MNDGRLFLVRHAKAGRRSDWHDADELRPLSKNGWQQALSIAGRLAARSPSALLTSPYLRCRQTLEPLAELVDLAISDAPCLAEGEPFAPVIDLLERLDVGVVLCSHGDVIPETIAALERRGCVVQRPADWRKGTVWSIDRVNGELHRARVWAPG